MADRASRPRRSLLTDVVSISVRLALLACAGLVAQVGWMLIWTLSYRLTHGNEFTYNFLVSQPLIWEKLRDFQVFANTLVPGVEILDVGPVHPDILYNAMVVGFVLTGLGYLAAILLIDVGVSAVRGALAVVLAFTAIFQVTLFLLPGLFTTDIFSYLMYGHISAIYELNPYIYPPNYFPNHELLGPAWIHPIWHDQPTVYGPLWTAIGWIMARLIAPLTLTEGVFAYKLLMNAVQVANLVLVWWLLRRIFPTHPRAQLTAFVVFAWNPLMQFDTAGNAHNDALMVTLLLLSVVPLVTFPVSNVRWSMSLICLALSALIKYITVGLFWPWLDYPRSLEPILRAADGKSWQFSNSAPDVIAMHIDNRLLNPPSLDPAAENHFYL
jgi:hypothetical protein